MAVLISGANSFAALRERRAQTTNPATPVNRALSHLAPAPTLSVSQNAISVTATGKTGTFRVTTKRNNDWTVTNPNPWIVITPTSGRGNKRLKFSVEPNSDCLERTGTFSINGRNVTVHQSSAPRNYSLSKSNDTFAASAAASSVGLNADCVWTLQTDADWISTSIPAGDNREGNATIVYAVTANSDHAARSGSIKILDGNSVVRQTLSVTQTGAPLSGYLFSPATAEFSNDGGSNTVELIAPDNAAWIIKPGGGVTNIFPTNGTGSATLHYSVLPNFTDTLRSNAIVVMDANSAAQETFAIIVAPVPPSASYSLSSTYLIFTANGGNVSVGLTANSSWIVQSDVNWINNFSPANGRSNAVIHYSVAANNTSGSRTGTLRILDGNSEVQQILQITQGGAAANFSLSSASANFGATGGSENVALTASSTWTVLVDVNWITRISPTTGTGNATIHYSIAPNTNATARSSSIRILDGNFVVQKTLVITQEGAPENYSLATGSNSPAGYRWSATLGTSGNDVGNAVATDSQGNILVTGNLDNYLFIEKYSSGGILIWSKTFYDNYGSGSAIALDQNDNVVVAGTFYSTLDFGAGPITSAGEYDSFVVKYSPDGAPLWAKRFGGSEGNDRAASLAVDSSGNILVTGTIVGTVPLAGKTYATGPFDNDIVLAKLSSSNGAFLWSKRFASTSDDNGLSVSVGPQDEVVLTGNFSGPINFGGGILTSDEHDVFLAKFSTSGAHLWSKKFGGALRDSGNGVAVDADGNIVLTGSFAGTIDFGVGVLSSASANYDDAFLAKFASDGSPLWSQNFGGTLADSGQGVSVDSEGNIALIGTFRDAIDFDGNALTGAGGNDVFVAKISPDGAAIWSKSFGSNVGADAGCAIAVDRQNNLVGAGTFFGAVNFGGGSQPSSGNADMFLISLAP